VTLTALAGCRVSARTLIDVHERGDGQVTVAVTADDAAAKQLGDPGSAVIGKDLAAAGWNVRAPRREGADWVWEASKPFGSPDGLQSVLAEIGPGWFEGFGVRLQDGFAKTTWTVHGTIATTGDPAQLSDGDVAKLLDGLPLGRSPEELGQDLGADATLPFNVAVRLPAAVDSGNGSPGDADSTRNWNVDLLKGGPQRHEVNVSATGRAAGSWTWFIAAGVLAVSAAGLVLLGRLRRRR
jgi:hypothetical protein